MRPLAREPDPQALHSRFAFSLVELVTLVLILTLVLMLVAPSLEAARGKSKQATCVERLRAIGEANAHYAADDDVGWAIPIHPKQFRQNPNAPSFIGAYEWGGKSGVGSNDWNVAPPPIGSRYGTRAGFGPATRPLNQYLYPHGFRDWGPPTIDRRRWAQDTTLQLDAFRCPADDGPPGGAHCPDWVNNPTRSSFDHFGTSYAANLFMIGSGSGSGQMVSNSPYLRPLSRVPSPARTLNYEENIGRWAWAARREPCASIVGVGVDPGPTKAIRGWHGKDWTYNRAFVDAHAERQSVYVEGSEDSQGYAEHYYNEFLSVYPVFPHCDECDPGSKDCPGDDGSFDSYRCIIVRGSGWQKDTMPAPLICTGLQRPSSSRPSFEGCVSSG